MIRVNVDIQEKKCTVHKSTCGHFLQEEMSLKGFEKSEAMVVGMISGYVEVL